MPCNALPRNKAGLHALADGFIRAAETREDIIGIKQNTAAVLQAALDAARQAELQLGLKNSALAQAFATLAAADEAGLRRLSDCKLRLAGKLGLRWHAGWEATGFPDQSTAVPRTMDPRYVLLSRLQAYFTAKLAMESEDMEATAALCEAAHTVLRQARKAVAEAKVARTVALRAQKEALAYLRRRMRGLIGELTQLLEDDDPVWEAFGLHRPAQPSAPESVVNVNLEAMGQGKLLASWPLAMRAVRYRVEVLAAGVDTDFRTGKSVQDLQALLKGFTAGQTVRVRIVASNGTGHAAPSDEKEVLVT